MKQSLKKIALSLLTLFWGAVALHAEEPADSTGAHIRIEHSFTGMAFVMTHQALRHTRRLDDWPFFAVASPVSWTTSLHAEKPFGKMLSFKGLASGTASFIDLGITGDLSLEVVRLLELGVSANIHSAINYSKSMSFMGVYNPQKRDYDNDIFMTEFAYGIKYRVGISLPLMLILPKSNWTKIILKPNANWTFTEYSGADDGEIWRCGQSYSVNGYRYRYGGTLVYLLPFEHVRMFMLNAGVGGFMKSAKFDEVFDGFDPYFKTVSIMPMLNFKFGEKWSGLLMTSISRNRTYEDYYYRNYEEFLQTRTGSEWQIRMIMMTFTRKF